jgi:hypothetical protein
MTILCVLRDSVTWILLRTSILTIVSRNLLWRYAAGCSVVRILRCLSANCRRWLRVCAAVLVGKVVMEMHRCWDVLGLVGSTGLVLSTLSAILALFRCASVSYYSILVQLF